MSSPEPSELKFVEAKTADVGLSDVQTALMNVRFEWNNGHDADVTRCLLMTHSGHATDGAQTAGLAPVCYFCASRHDPSQSSPGGVFFRLSMRLMKVIDGPSFGTDSSAATKARSASSHRRAR
jgi:hypothetical protein